MRGDKNKQVPVSLVSPGLHPEKFKDILILVAFAVFGVLLCQLTYLKAIFYTNSGTATVLQYTGPVFILIFICLKSRQLPTKIEFLSILLAVSGIFLLATHGNLSTLVISKEGLFWGLMSALGLSTYTLIPKGLLHKYGSAVTMSTGIIISGIIAFFLLRFWCMDFTLDTGTVFAACGVVFIGTLLSFLMYMEGVKLIGPVKASMLASVEPFSATVFSVVWMGTQFMYIDIIGFIFILSTIFLLAREKQ